MDPEKFLNYNSSLLDFAKINRKNMTKYEGIFWHIVLKKKQMMGYKFRRQKVIDSFILDFYCSELKLGIEIDGGYHNDVQDYDEARSKVLADKYGIKIVRFTNENVENNLDGVVLEMEEIVKNRCKELNLE